MDATGDGMDDVLAEQRDFYRDDAHDYDAWFAHLADVGNDDPDAVTFRAGRARIAALHAELAPLGDVVELAAGTGVGTELLVPHARSLTLVDSSGPSLDLARRRVAALGATDVTTVEADVLAWDGGGRRFDTVVFSAWTHHVPDERWDGFWTTVAGLLAPGGRVVFDVQRPAAARPEAPADPPSEASHEYHLHEDGHGLGVRDHRARRWRVVHVRRPVEGVVAYLSGRGWAATVVAEGWSADMIWLVATRP